MKILPIVRRANIAYLRFHESTFPDTFVNPLNRNDVVRDVRAAMKAAMTAAIVQWNQSCNPASMLNDQPVLVPVHSDFEPPAGSENVFVVDVKYRADFSGRFEECQYYPGHECAPAVADTAFYDD